MLLWETLGFLQLYEVHDISGSQHCKHNFNSCFVFFTQEQLKLVQEEHQRTTDMLRRQVDNSEREMYRLERELQRARSTPTSAEVPDNNENVAEFSRDPRHEERQQGEGSETTDDVAFKTVQVCGLWNLIENNYWNIL